MLAHQFQRRADVEMELIRAEETQDAAALIAGAHHNLAAAHNHMKNADRELGKHEHGVPDAFDLRIINDLLQLLEESVEESLSDLARLNPAPVDPLTGQPFTRVPASVKISTKDGLLIRCDENPQEVLAEQRSTIRKLKRRAEKVSESEDYQRRQAERQEEPEYLALLEEQIAAQREHIREVRTAQVIGPANGEVEASSSASSSERTTRTRRRGR